MKCPPFFLLVLIFTLCACTSLEKEENLVNRASEAETQKNWTEAVDIYTELIQRNPDNALYYFQRFFASGHIGRTSTYDDQIGDLKTALEKDSTIIEAEFCLFLAYMFANDFDKSLATINKLIAKRGETPFLLSWKGNCAFAGKKFKVAESSYEKRLQYPGNNEELQSIYYYWMFSKYFGGNKEGALWDCGFLPDRGFQENLELLELISSDKLVWEELANFYIPEWSVEEIRDNLKEGLPKND